MSSQADTVLVVSIPDHASRCYRFSNTEVTVGRGKNNHLILDHQAISWKHGEFVKKPEAGGWFFRDLDSTNGSKINGHQVSSDAISIHDGDSIVLGEQIELRLFEVREFEKRPSEDEEGDGDLGVNPVAAAVARQVREDEGTRTLRLKEKRGGK